MQNLVVEIAWKLEYLSPELLAEVDDFIDFLQLSDQDKILWKKLTSVSAFAKIWDNDDDAIYDTLWIWRGIAV